MVYDLRPLGIAAELLPAAKLKPEPRPPKAPLPNTDLDLPKSGDEKPKRCPTALPADAAAFPNPACRGVCSELLLPNIGAADLPRDAPVTERDSFGAEALLDAKANGGEADECDLSSNCCFGNAESTSDAAELVKEGVGTGSAAASGTSSAIEGLLEEAPVEEPLDSALMDEAFEEVLLGDAPASWPSCCDSAGSSGMPGV